MTSNTWTPVASSLSPYASGHQHHSTPESEVVELVLLLPEWQMESLEAKANQRGMTVGQLLRRVLSEICPRHGSDDN